MKIFKPALIILLVFIIPQLYYSCIKDYSYEGGAPSIGSVILKGSTNGCVDTVYGTYKAGTILDSSNYILDSVTVTREGNYTIVTDTLNGIGFKATGRFKNTGQYAVKLIGYGTPRTTGTYNYALTYDSSNCVVSITFN